jgi:tetratricopeptide (TPR) repeat protein
MAIKGSLKEASLPDVIQLLAMGQKTGVLTVTEKEHFGSITFFKGKIVDSYLINRKNRIGELLVISGEMSEEQLQYALGIQKKTGEKIGKILLDEQYVREETLISYLKQQIKETIVTMMTWENGFFNFEPRFTGVSKEIIAVDPASLLLESARHVDELTGVTLDILRDSSILKPSASQEEYEELDDITKKVYSLIDGEKTLEMLLEFSPFDKFDTKEILSNLVDKELCTIIERASLDGSEKIMEHLNLGIAFLKTQLYDEAEREFKHIIKVSPKNIEARFYLSVVLTKTKNYKDAEELLRKLIKDNPDIQIYKNNLGYILDMREQSEDAYSLFEEASEMKSSGIPLLNLGVICFKKREYTKAMEWFTKALEINKEMILPHFFLALIDVIVGNLKSAMNAIKEMLKKSPEIPVLYYNLGVITEKVSDFGEAERNYKRALDLAPNYIEPRMRLGELYYRIGKFTQAQSCFEMITDAGLGNAEIFLKLGNIYYKVGEKEKAVEQWKKTLKLEPHNEIAKNNIEMARE